MQSFPVAVGGIGGSGTRVIAAILRRFGYYLGSDLNEALDNLWFTLLFKRQSLWPIHSHRAEIGRLMQLFVCTMTRRQQQPEEGDLRLLAVCRAEATEELPLEWRERRYRSLLDAMRDQPDQSVTRWGWKEPNTHVVFPELKRSVPDLRYIHVIRHGVDMALSSNQNQLRHWGRCILGRPVNPNEPADSLAFWCEVHRRLMEMDERHGTNTMLLNFDKFCREPRAGLQSLMSFLDIGHEHGAIDEICAGISIPLSTGRHVQVKKSRFAREDLEFVRQFGFELGW